MMMCSDRNWKNLSGAGLIITGDVIKAFSSRNGLLLMRVCLGVGNVCIDGRYKEAPGNVAIEDETHMEKLKEWAREGQSDTTKLVVQLSHRKFFAVSSLVAFSITFFMHCSGEAVPCVCEQ
jgi:hypothetical protein